MDTTYLVIGGTGRTGRRVAHQLTRRGHPVRVTSRRGAPAEFTEVSVVQGLQRSAFFMQDFSEHFWLDAVRSRRIAVPAGQTAAGGDPMRYWDCAAEQFVAGAVGGGMPEPEARMLAHVFGQVLDGRNADLSGDLQDVLGRPGRDFADYARHTAATGVWSRAGQPARSGRR